MGHQGKCFFPAQYEGFCLTTLFEGINFARHQQSFLSWPAHVSSPGFTFTDLISGGHVPIWVQLTDLPAIRTPCGGGISGSEDPLHRFISILSRIYPMSAPHEYA